MKAYVMVGAPGSGKSTFAAGLVESENAFVVNGDNIREELYGSADIQGNWVEIHDRIEELVSEACGMTVVLDNTHYRASYRKEAISLLRSFGYDEIEAVILNPSLATCLARNFKRSRNVPDYVVKKMYTSLQSSLTNIHQEGFSAVTYV